MLRFPRPLPMFAALLCTASALIGSSVKAHADLNIVFPPSYTTPITLNTAVSGNVTVSNPYHVPNATVVILSDAKISGSVTVRDDVAAYTLGQVSGTLATYNTSQTQVLMGSVGAVQTYGASQVVIGSPYSVPVTLGALECHDYSQVSSNGSTVGPNAHTITIDHVITHDGAELQLSGCTITHNINVYDQACLDLRYCTISNVEGTDQGEVSLSSVYCSGFVHQIYSCYIFINVGTLVQGDVQAVGWPYGIDALPGDRLFIHGGTFNGSVSAVGGLIDIDGGKFKGPFYAMKRPVFNGGPQHSLRVYGKNLVVSPVGMLTGTLADGTAINVPCSGAVELTHY